MKYFVFFCLALATCQASIIPAIQYVQPVSAIIKGASARAASVGSDGASASLVEGATVAKIGNGAALLSPGLIAKAVAPAIPVGPIIAPAVVAAAPAVVAAPVVAAPIPAVSGAVIAGPSGTVATSNGVGLGIAPVVAGPAVAKAVVVGGHGW